MIASFADDAVYVTAHKSREHNQNRISQMLSTLKTYLNNNGMSVNPSKTVLFEFMLKQKLCKTQGAPPYLVTLTDQGAIRVISPKESSVCLGGTLAKGSPMEGDDRNWGGSHPATFKKKVGRS